MKVYSGSVVSPTTHLKVNVFETSQPQEERYMIIVVSKQIPQNLGLLVHDQNHRDLTLYTTIRYPILIKS